MAIPEDLDELVTVFEGSRVYHRDTRRFGSHLACGAVSLYVRTMTLRWAKAQGLRCCKKCEANLLKHEQWFVGRKE